MPNRQDLYALTASGGVFYRNDSSDDGKRGEIAESRLSKIAKSPIRYITTVVELASESVYALTDNGHLIFVERGVSAKKSVRQAPDGVKFIKVGQDSLRHFYGISDGSAAYVWDGTTKTYTPTKLRPHLITDSPSLLDGGVNAPRTAQRMIRCTRFLPATDGVTKRGN